MCNKPDLSNLRYWETTLWTKGVPLATLFSLVFCCAYLGANVARTMENLGLGFYWQYSAIACGGLIGWSVYEFKFVELMHELCRPESYYGQLRKVK